MLAQRPKSFFIKNFRDIVQVHEDSVGSVWVVEDGVARETRGKTFFTSSHAGSFAMPINALVDLASMAFAARASSPFSCQQFFNPLSPSLPHISIPWVFDIGFWPYSIGVFGEGL